MTRPTRTSSAPHAPPHSGFTIIEMLVVIVIIALLVAITGVVYSRVMTGARRSATENFLRNMAQGIEQFHADFGYYPPMLDDDEEHLQPDHPQRLTVVAASDDPVEHYEENRYFSVYTLPIYLLGMGDLNGDEVLDAADDGVAGPGFRDPGPDRSWGGARERIYDAADPADSTHKPASTGRAYGPYIDVSSGRNFMEEPAHKLYKFVDRWDTPIRYYTAWPKTDAVDPTIRTLARTPVELRTAESLLDQAGTDVAETHLDPDLLNAPYALLSAGPDADFGERTAEGESIGDRPQDDSTFDELEQDEKADVIDRVADNVRVLP